MAKTNHNIPKESHNQQTEPIQSKSVTSGVVIGSAHLKTKATNKIDIFVYILIGLLVIATAGWLFSFYNKDKTSSGCSSDKILVNRYNNAINATAPSGEYANILNLTKGKQPYKTDITCQYIVFQSSIRLGDELAAREAYMILKQLYDEGQTLPDDLFTNGQSIELLIEQYKYYDKDSPQPDGVG